MKKIINISKSIASPEATWRLCSPDRPRRGGGIFNPTPSLRAGGIVVFSRSAADTNGNIYITGYYTNTFSYGGLSAPVLAVGMTNFFLLKTDVSGNALWLTNASSTSVLTVTATAVTTDSNDGVYIGLSCVNTASSNQTVMLGTATFTHQIQISSHLHYRQIHAIDRRVFVGRNPDPNSASAITGLAVTSNNGSLIVTGDFQGAASFSGLPLTALPPGAHNTFLIRMSATTGVAVWVTNAACVLGGYNRSGGIALDGAGNVYTTGYFGGTMFSGTSYQLTAHTNTPANSSAFIVKWTNNTAGTLATPQWALATTDTSNSFTSANDLAVDVNSNLYVSFSLARTDPNSTNVLGLNLTGTGTGGSTHYTQTNGGTSEGSVVKFDSNGNILWGEGTLGAAKRPPNSNTRIAVTPNFVYSLGSFGPGSVTFGGTTTLGTPGDSFILQISKSTGGLGFVVPVNPTGATPSLMPQDLIASTGNSADLLDLVGTLGGSPGSNSFIAQLTVGGPSTAAIITNSIPVPNGGCMIGNPLIPVSNPLPVSTIFPVTTNFLELKKPLNGAVAGNCYTPGLGWYNPAMTLDFGEGCIIGNSGPALQANFIGYQITGTVTTALAPGSSVVTALKPSPGLSPYPFPYPFTQAVGNNDTVYAATNMSGTSYYDPITYIAGYGWFDPSNPDNFGSTNGPPLTLGQSFWFQNVNSQATLINSFTNINGLQTNKSITPASFPNNEYVTSSLSLFDGGPWLPVFPGVQLVEAAGANISLSTASNAGVAFQWQRNGVNLVNDAHVSGATSNVLTVVNIQAGLNDGTYAVVASNQYGYTGALVASVQTSCPGSPDLIPSQTNTARLASRWAEK